MLRRLLSQVLGGRREAAAAEVSPEAARAAYRADKLDEAVRLLRALDARGEAGAGELHMLAVSLARLERPAEALPVLGRALQLEFGISENDEAARLRSLLEFVWREPFERWQRHLEAFSQYGWLAERGGVLRASGDALVQALAARDPASLPAGRDEDAVFASLRLLEFRAGADPVHIERVLKGLVLPWMRRAAHAGRWGLVLMLETHAYGAYVMQTEGEARFREAFALWTDLLREAGRRAAKGLAPLARAVRDGPPRIAFFLHSGSYLAHTRVLFEFLDALRALQPAALEAVVFHRGKPSRELAQRAAAIGVSCRSLAAESVDGSSNDYASLLALRREVAAQGIDAVVWVSIATHMAFAFSLRVAPVQIWWALKYHSLEFPEIDGYLTSGSAGSTKRVAGKLWRSAPLCDPRWHRPELARAAAETRARFAQHPLLFGCLGREGKLNSPLFLGAVCAILHARPEAGFLWTGRERHPAIQSWFEASGVADRCHFIGWVDTKLYSQVIDVFLDSFPFPCGFTLYEAMAAARPAVVFASPESEETGLHGMLTPLLAGEVGSDQERARARAVFGSGRESLFLCARDEREYVAHALRLATEPALRREAGEANQRFVAEFLSDPERMARTLATHLVELARGGRA